MKPVPVLAATVAAAMALAAAAYWFAPAPTVRSKAQWATVESIRDCATQGHTDPELVCLSIWAFLHANLRHKEPAFPGIELHSPVALLNLYGGGYCDDFAAAFEVLARSAGIPAECVCIGGHVVSQAYYGGRGHVFDCDMGYVYFDADFTRVLSLRDLEQSPEPAVLQYPQIGVMYGTAPSEPYTGWTIEHPK